MLLYVVFFLMMIIIILLLYNSFKNINFFTFFGIKLYTTITKATIRSNI